MRGKACQTKKSTTLPQCSWLHENHGQGLRTYRNLTFITNTLYATFQRETM